MMDINPIIKMFDHLKEKICKADNFELRSLQKIPNIEYQPFGALF